MVHTKTELVRMALHYAILDRSAYADADIDQHGKDAAALADEFRAYLMERFNEKPMYDDLMEGVMGVPIAELLNSKPRKFKSRK